jgi:hypothetical protein
MEYLQTLAHLQLAFFDQWHERGYGFQSESEIGFNNIRGTCYQQLLIQSEIERKAWNLCIRREEALKVLSQPWIRIRCLQASIIREYLLLVSAVDIDAVRITIHGRHRQ